MNTDLMQLFAQTFEISTERLLPEATLESLGLDSLAVIEFLFQIEDKFGIQIPDQASPPGTLGEMAQLVTPLLSQGHPGSFGMVAGAAA